MSEIIGPCKICFKKTSENFSYFYRHIPHKSKLPKSFSLLIIANILEMDHSILTVRLVEKLMLKIISSKNESTLLICKKGSKIILLCFEFDSIFF